MCAHTAAPPPKHTLTLLRPEAPPDARRLVEQPRVVDGLAARRRPRAADVLPQRDALRDVSVLVAREAALLAARRLQPQVLLALALSVRAQAVARLGALRVALVVLLVLEAPAAAASPRSLAREPRPGAPPGSPAAAARAPPPPARGASSRSMTSL